MRSQRPPEPPTPEELEAIYERAFRRVGSFAALARLTDRQIHFLAMDRGSARAGEAAAGVDAPPSLIPEGVPEIEQDAAALFGVGRSFGVPYDRLLVEWQKKYPGRPPPGVEPW